VRTTRLAVVGVEAVVLTLAAPFLLDFLDSPATVRRAIALLTPQTRTPLTQ
jgi:hypothetical protein